MPKPFWHRFSSHSSSRGARMSTTLTNLTLSRRLSGALTSRHPREKKSARSSQTLRRERDRGVRMNRERLLFFSMSACFVVGLMIGLPHLAVGDERAQTLGAVGSPIGSGSRLEVACPSLQRELDELKQKKKQVDEMLANALGAQKTENQDDPFFSQKYKEWIAAYQSDQFAVMAHRQNAYKWQEHASTVVLILVVLVVVSGVAFSGYQLYKSVNIPKAMPTGAAPTPEVHSEGNLATDFRVSQQGIQITSSVVGIVVLAISLAFLYLFIANVYPINPR
jgi:hypothetical protein